MANMMTVYAARAIESLANPEKRICMDECLIRNVTPKSLCIKLSYQEWNHLMPPSTVISGILVRCFFKSNYIIAYGSSFNSSKRALNEFLERYPLKESIKPSFDYAVSTSTLIHA